MKIRYTIEANVKTLARFMKIINDEVSPDVLRQCFIYRVTTNSTEEYYYVVLLAPDEVHLRLKAHRFTNSVPVR